MRAYKYRLYPSRKQEDKLLHQFTLCRDLYNSLLQQCKEAYKVEGKTLRKRQLFKIVTEVKKGELNSELNDVYSQVLQNCADRLIKAYDNFFRRMKLRKRGVKVKAGFPRFKKRWRSITYPQFGFKFLSERRLSVSKIGNIPIILHRPTEGKVKTLTIKRNSVGQWFAMFTCETEKVLETHPHVDKKIGIDLGLESFATLSDGTRVNNPRCLVKTERRLKRMQRKLSRTKKSSNRRWKIHLPGLALQA